MAGKRLSGSGLGRRRVFFLKCCDSTIRPPTATWPVRVEKRPSRRINFLPGGPSKREVIEIREGFSAVFFVGSTCEAQPDFRGARGSNAGDDFHELWAVRRALALLDQDTELKGMTVEGLKAEDGRGVPAETRDGVDCAGPGCPRPVELSWTPKQWSFYCSAVVAPTIRAGIHPQKVTCPVLWSAVHAAR
jgi:hypothetical protein